MDITFRPDDVDPAVMYRTIVGSVVPRPIGWISTVDSDGVDNIAPFSFFGVGCVDPPILHFTAGTYADGRMKDTAQNIHETEEFVHNLVSERTLEGMHASSQTIDSDQSEFDVCDIERAPSETVAPPRVANAVASFECSLHQAIDLGTHTMYFGEIEYIHIDESATTDEKIDIDKFNGIGRLTAGRYLTFDSQFTMESIKEEDFPKTEADD